MAQPYHHPSWSQNSVDLFSEYWRAFFDGGGVGCRPAFRGCALLPIFVVIGVHELNFIRLNNDGKAGSFDGNMKRKE